MTEKLQTNETIVGGERLVYLFIMNIARRGEEEWKKMLVCMHQTSCVVNEKKHALSLSGAFLACRAQMTGIPRRK